jgi:hypothetical protein
LKCIYVMYPSHCVSSGRPGFVFGSCHLLIFFLFWSFLIIILEMNPVKHFFSNLALLSHASSLGATYEGITSVHLARLMKESRQFTWRLKGLACARSPRWSGWCHVVSVAPVRSAQLVLNSHQFIQRDSIL